MEILTSLHGRLLGLGRNGELVVPDGVIVGRHANQIVMPSPDIAALFDDFLGGGQAYGTTIIDAWRSRKGTTNAVDFTRTGAKGGTVVGTIGDTTASMAVSGVQLDAGLDWYAEQGRLRFQCRIKMSVITNIAVFLGFTDQVSALEMPIQSAASANTLTTNATDAVGWMFDTSMTDDNWWLVGVDNGTDATHEDTEVAPVVDTYEVLGIELDESGNAVFFRNGIAVGAKMSDAVKADVALTPVIAGFNRTTTGTPTLTADYINVSALRA